MAFRDAFQKINRIDNSGFMPEDFDSKIFYFLPVKFLFKSYIIIRGEGET
jgi:hypothetical protein